MNLIYIDAIFISFFAFVTVFFLSKKRRWFAKHRKLITLAVVCASSFPGIFIADTVCNLRQCSNFDRIFVGVLLAFLMQLNILGELSDLD